MNKMTVKKRLSISNVIMIISPVLITALVGVACLVAVYYTLHHSNGFGFDDSEDFYNISQSIADESVCF